MRRFVSEFSEWRQSGSSQPDASETNGPLARPVLCHM